MKITKDGTVLYVDLRERETVDQKADEACSTARDRQCDFVEFYRDGRWVETRRASGERVKRAA
jgi:hypothetical protein